MGREERSTKASRLNPGREGEVHRKTEGEEFRFGIHKAKLHHKVSM